MRSRRVEGIGRREFLIASSTCAVAAVALGPSRLMAADAAPKRFAVGFVALDGAPAAADPFTPNVIAASRVPAGDGGFIGRGARVTVMGVSGASADPQARRTTEVLTHFTIRDGEQKKVVPFRAWACSRTSGCGGNRVNFTVPVDDEQRMTFSLTTERGKTVLVKDAVAETVAKGDVVQTAVPVTLSLLSEPDALKLTRGFYVITPLFDDQDEPRWSAYQLRLQDGRWSLYEKSGDDLAPADFEHVVIRIDYANR